MGKDLRIEPEEVYRGTPVRVAQAVSLPADARLEWLVNDAPAPDAGGGAALDTGRLRKGDTIRARASGPGGTAVSQAVTVRNSPPEVRGVRFLLGIGEPGASLGVEGEGYDADGDPVRIEIAWRKNGQAAGTGTRIGAPLSKGDKVEVTLTPFDGEARGKSATLSREIRNTNPVIEGHDQFQVRENVVMFHVRASDGDGDPLTYAIRDAPAGMQIDRTTGWVRWEPPPGATGKVPFTVTVSDGSGGETTARIAVTISELPASGAQ